MAYTHYGPEPIDPKDDPTGELARGNLGGGMWRKGSQIDKEHWSKLNQARVDENNDTYEFLKKTIKEHPEYDLSSFMLGLDEKIKGYGGDTGNTFDSGSFQAPDERFKEFLGYKGGNVKPIFMSGLETGNKLVDLTSTGGKLPADQYKYGAPGLNLTGTTPPQGWETGNIAQSVQQAASTPKSNVALPAQLRQRSGGMFRNRNMGMNKPAMNQPAMNAGAIQNAASNQNIQMTSPGQPVGMQPSRRPGFAGSLLKPKPTASLNQNTGTMQTAYGNKQPVLKAV